MSRGLLVASSGTQVGPFGFVGKEGYQTDASGLMLLGHRYYDPSTGRFLTRDPVKDGRNWYGYCANDPLDVVDPSGTVIYIHRGAGWTDDEWHEVLVTLKKIQGTKRGHAIAFDYNGDLTIAQGTGGSHENHLGPGKVLVVIDPSDKNRTINTTAGPQHPTFIRILAHEVGHGTGTLDDGPGNMNSVNQNENPIMLELNGAARTTYP